MTPPLTPSQSDRLRAAFPHLSRRVYLDTAAVGLAFEGQGAAVARFFDAMKSQGWDARPQWHAVNDRAKRRLAALVNVPPGDLAWLSNTTEGLNLAARGLRWAPGDRVVMAADEFASVTRAFDFVRGAGAEVVAVPMAAEVDREARLIEAIDARTRVVAVSHVHASTGTRLDLGRLAAACRERDALLVVDGVQALGAVPVDASQADVYCAAHFKWLLGSFGIAMFATSARARERIAPVAHGYMNEAHGGFQYAHANLPGAFALDAALDLFDGIGWPAVHAQVAHLAAALIDGLRRAGRDVVTPPHACAGIVSVRSADADAAQRALDARGIAVAMRDGLLRISPHVYNTDADIDALLRALAGLPSTPAEENPR
jgi:selenocysteine lyase/cysteine desulfurase